MEALTDHTSVSDIQGALTVTVIGEYFELWDLLSDIVLQPGFKGSHTWKSRPLDSIWLGRPIEVFPGS